MSQNLNKQKGATLVMGLILMLILTLIGITSMKNTALEEKMAASLRNKVMAEKGAESALRAAEHRLWNYFAESNGAQLIADPEAGTNGSLVYTFNADDVVEFRTNREDFTHGIEHPYNFENQEGAKLFKNPKYIIEEVAASSLGGPAEFGDDTNQSGQGSAGLLKAFRITAKSYSGDGKTVAMVESVFTSRTN